MTSTGHFPQYPTSDGVIYKVVSNDGTPEALISLIGAKNVFSVQLPKMPKEYIARLVMDRNHRTMVIQQQSSGRIIGGICYRPFPTQRFAEIVFCAITSTEQGRGYGRLVMAYLKEHVKNENIDYFLTYADNYAIKYFAKQAFTKTITMNHERWRSWIKDYDGATLMECGIVKEVNYITMKNTISAQVKAVHQRLANISLSKRVWNIEKQYNEYQAELEQTQANADASAAENDPSAAPPTSSFFPIPLRDIPGMNNYPQQLASYPEARCFQREKLILTARLSRVLTALFASRDAWPFRSPVDAAVVVDYYSVIKQPMDLTTMKTKLNGFAYVTSRQFEEDVGLIAHNCKLYNGPQTTYYRSADDFWNLYVQLAGLHEIHQPIIFNPGSSIALTKAEIQARRENDPQFDAYVDALEQEQSATGSNILPPETVVRVQL